MTVRKCTESHECASSVINAPVLISVASSPVQAAQHFECAAHAPLDKLTAGQHTPHSTLPVGEHWPWYVCVPCTSVSHTTRSDTTACHCMHGEHGQASLPPWMQPCGLCGSYLFSAARCMALFLLMFCHPLTPRTLHRQRISAQSHWPSRWPSHWCGYDCVVCVLS